MPTRQSLFRILAAAAVCAAIFASCSGGKIGYGVVLWSPDKSNLVTGQTVTVRSESKINNTYALASSGTKGTVDVPTWRIKLFSTEKEAVNFSLSYSPLVPLFAKATSNGAPIRDTPDAAATRLYRLRQDQVVKVIAKDPKQVTIDGVNGYWYQVLTNDGVMGYSFDANLQVFNPSNQAQQQTSVGQLLLNQVLATTFRPQYFQQMIDNNHIDLKRFSPAYGFFANPSSKSVRIVMPDHEVSFNYSDIKDVGSDDYTFTGTPLEMIIQNPDQIRLLYSDSNGNQYDQTFVNIKQDIGLLVEKERNRRLQIYTTFLDKTPFSSDYYGKIDLGSNMGFRWTGFSRLVPDIIPAGAGATGVVDFPLYLSESLSGKYDGVISFIFGARPQSVDPSGGASLAAISPPLSGGAAAGGNSTTGGQTLVGSSGKGAAGGANTPSGGSGQGSQVGSAVPAVNHPTVSFLYSFADGGVKLTYVPQSTIDTDTVTNVSSTPIIIFFSFK
ncbi:MAG TPA: SH3 domain-containing protein [Spirochaetia bacterium]|nr:SH3 domain-containing protein [Spirochaetia bacterium]